MAVGRAKPDFFRTHVTFQFILDGVCKLTQAVSGSFRSQYQLFMLTKSVSSPAPQPRPFPAYYPQQQLHLPPHNPPPSPQPP